MRRRAVFHRYRADDDWLWRQYDPAWHGRPPDFSGHNDFGVTLFFNLARALLTPSKVRFPRTICGLNVTDNDAVHQACGYSVNTFPMRLDLSRPRSRVCFRDLLLLVQELKALPQ